MTHTSIGVQQPENLALLQILNSVREAEKIAAGIVQTAVQIQDRQARYQQHMQQIHSIACDTLACTSAIQREMRLSTHVG